MNLKSLGASDLLVSPLAFGGNVLGWTINETQAFAVLDAYVAGGGNFIDTADIYCRWATGQGGESETILGTWMRQRKNRRHIVLATKAGMDMGGGKTGLSKKYILRAVEDSLRRLQTDYIDLYQSHKDDESLPVEEPLEAFAQLIREGKVRYIGASNFSATRLDAAMQAAKQGLPGYQTLQPHYNLLERRMFETELEPLCLQHKLSVINYFPLASGFLTGKYRHENDLAKSIRGAGLAKYMTAKNLKLLQALHEIATKHTCSTAAVVLSWYLARPTVAAPIASATSVAQLNELLPAMHLKLAKDEIDFIAACSAY